MKESQIKSGQKKVERRRRKVGERRIKWNNTKPRQRKPLVQKKKKEEK